MWLLKKMKRADQVGNGHVLVATSDGKEETITVRFPDSVVREIRATQAKGEPVRFTAHQN
jgi:hypothetical protein